MAVSYGQDYGNSDNLAGLLARCYQEELLRYRALISLAEKVSGEIMAANLDEVTDNLGRQATLVDEIQNVDKQATALRREVAHKFGLSDVTLPALKTCSGGGALSDLQCIMEEMAVTLQSLAEIQDANKSLLSVHLSSVRDELTELRRAKAAAKAYFPVQTGAEEARFVDRKS